MEFAFFLGIVGSLASIVSLIYGHLQTIRMKELKEMKKMNSRKALVQVANLIDEIEKSKLPFQNALVYKSTIIKLKSLHDQLLGQLIEYEEYFNGYTIDNWRKNKIINFNWEEDVAKKYNK